MVRRVLPSVMAALAVMVLPQIVAAAESEQRPQRPGPASLFGRAGGRLEVTRMRPPAGAHPGGEALFKRLDANDDGKVTLGEIPDRAPDHLKELLKKADKDGNKSVSKEELAEAMKKVQDVFRRRPPGPPSARPGSPHAKPGPAHRPGSPEAKSRSSRSRGPGHFGSTSRFGRSGPPGAHFSPSRRPGPPQAARGPQHRGGPPRVTRGPHGPDGPPHAGPRGGLPDPKVIFDRLDKDNDKKLSLEEFATGMRELHRARPPHGRSMSRGPAGPPSRRPTGPPSRRPGPPHGSFSHRLGMFGAELFKKADANKDGKVSLDEVPEDRREGFKKLLKKADKDGDHALSAEEGRKLAERAAEFRKQFFAKMAERHRDMHGAARRHGPEAAKRAAEARRKSGEHKRPEHKRAKHKRAKHKRAEHKRPEHKGREHEKSEHKGHEHEGHEHEGHEHV